MNLQTFLDMKGMTKYRLSKISGIPKTTIIDICSGKSSLEKCSAKTVLLLAQALECSMEEIMKMDNQLFDEETGKPMDQSYLEEELPPFLRESVQTMILAWKRKESEGYRDWDCDYCNLQSDINIAEVENLITSEQAWYLREKYLYLERPGELD